MTKKNVGLNKGKVIRIHEDVKKQLIVIRTELKMSARHNEGDVVKELVKMFQSKKVGDVYQSQPNLDDFNKMYEEQVERIRRWKARFDYVCQKYNIDRNEIMQIELG